MLILCCAYSWLRVSALHYTTYKLYSGPLALYCVLRASTVEDFHFNQPAHSRANNPASSNVRWVNALHGQQPIGTSVNRPSGHVAPESSPRRHESARLYSAGKVVSKVVHVRIQAVVEVKSDLVVALRY
ncbi:hypothetical protein LZ32DRAFT_459572 [Colletotrichum eremochloae]|nr:hypothetical protein LZ32DRAFT_459572 [Colletotrichum eremochloae]